MVYLEFKICRLQKSIWGVQQQNTLEKNIYAGDPAQLSLQFSLLSTNAYLTFDSEGFIFQLSPMEA